MSESEIKCVHCGRKIEDLSEAWSRSGEHWCGWGCYDQDQYPNLVEERKERARQGEMIITDKDGRERTINRRKRK